MISDDILEEVRQKNEISDIISKYVKLEKKGQYLFGLCPFHKEKTASFSVTTSKQIYYCYSCRRGGNVIQFIMEAENLSFLDSVKLLAEQSGVYLPENSDNLEKERMQQKKEIIRLNTECARFFHNCLLSEQGKSGREYLTARGLDDRTGTKFGIGYAPDEWNALSQFIQEKDFDESIINESGMLVKDKNGKWIDRFRNRIIFPIFDIRGNLIAFGGRALGDGMPKYLNSPETKVYTKGNHLYGLNFAKSAGNKKLIIVEGYMDVVSLHQFGIHNVVAPLGTALTREQGRILRMYSEEVIISFDSDSAGQAATMRSLDVLTEAGCSVKVLEITKGKDPDDFIRTFGVDSFLKLVQNSINFIEYKIKVLRKEINTDNTDGKINFLNKVAGILAKVENNIEKEMFIKKISREYQISEDALLREIYKKMPTDTARTPRHIEIPAKQAVLFGGAIEENKKLMYYERMLLALIIEDNGLFKKYREKFSPDLFTNPDNQTLADIMAKRLDKKCKIETAEFLGWLEGESLQEFSTLLEKDVSSHDNLNRAFVDILKKTEILKLDARQSEILKQLKTEISEVDAECLKTELQKVLIDRRNLL